MRISILIPCYNAKRWVAAAIQSALAQTWRDKEIVVVDDGSTDGSLEEIEKFGGCIRWETHPNRGSNAARNRLLQLARGEWLQYLDADDYLLPEHIGQQVAASETFPQADVIYSPVTFEYWPPEVSEAEVMSARQNTKRTDLANNQGVLIRREVLPIHEPHDVWVLLIRWYLPQTGAVLWRRTALEEVGGWKPDQPCCQEHELYFRLLAAEKRFAFNAQSGAVYRQWSTNTLCRRDPLQTTLRRLDVVAHAEEHLTCTDKLTPARCQAIGLTRLECARSLYQRDRQMAVRIAAEGQRLLYGEPLPPEPAFSRAYRTAHRLVGFRGAERIAAAVRPFRRRE